MGNPMSKTNTMTGNGVSVDNCIVSRGEFLSLDLIYLNNNAKREKIRMR